MSKRTITFYSSEEKAEIKRLFSLPVGKSRRLQIENYAKSIGRTTVQLAKIASNQKQRLKGIEKQKPPIVQIEKQSARTNGSEVRFKFSNFRVDMATSEVVFTIGK